MYGQQIVKKKIIRTGSIVTTHKAQGLGNDEYQRQSSDSVTLTLKQINHHKTSTSTSVHNIK